MHILSTMWYIEKCAKETCTHSFFVTHMHYIQVNANGLLSFREEHNVANIRSFQSQDLPSIPLIAPFWADVNIEQGGEIFYRQTDSPMSLQHAVDLLQAAQVSSDVKRNFRPTNVFIATWDRVVGFAVDTDVSADCKFFWRAIIMSLPPYNTIDVSQCHKYLYNYGHCVVLKVCLLLYL